MMCCGAIEWEDEKPNGECEKCGAETVDGEAYHQCYYSPLVCEECSYKPCDGSC